MIQVKEFLNYQDNSNAVNEWLSENTDKKIIDIKYAVGTFQENRSCDASEYSGVLIIYKTS